MLSQVVPLARGWSKDASTRLKVGKAAKAASTVVTG
jgi:hypothetical protein